MNILEKYPLGFWSVYTEMQKQNFEESMCDETKLKVLCWVTAEFTKRGIIK